MDQLTPGHLCSQTVIKICLEPSRGLIRLAERVMSCGIPYLFI